MIGWKYCDLADVLERTRAEFANNENHLISPVRLSSSPIFRSARQNLQGTESISSAVSRLKGLLEVGLAVLRPAKSSIPITFVGLPATGL